MKHVDIGRGQQRSIFPCHVSIILLLASILKIWSRSLLLGSLGFGSTTFKMACVYRVTRDFTIRAYHLIGSSVHCIWRCGRPGFLVMTDHKYTFMLLLEVGFMFK